MIREAFLACALAAPVITGICPIDEKPTSRVEFIRMLVAFAGEYDGPERVLVIGQNLKLVSVLRRGGIKAFGLWRSNVRGRWRVRGQRFNTPFPAEAFRVIVNEDRILENAVIVSDVLDELDYLTKLGGFIITPSRDLDFTDKFMTFRQYRRMDYSDPSGLAVFMKHGPASVKPIIQVRIEKVIHVVAALLPPRFPPSPSLLKRSA